MLGDSSRHMKIYELKNVVPAWHFDPATFGQLKVLRFFGTDITKPFTKGVASGIIGRLFSDPTNKHLWAAYVYTTGDEEHVSTELLPHDKAVLARTQIPDDWRPKRGPSTPSKKRKALAELIGTILKDGSPFDDPLPEIAIAGRAFCFTGRFEFGSRRECQEAVVARAGSFTDNITSKTDVLVIGSDANPAWAHDGYGNKIEDAMVLRMERRRLAIIPEAFWRILLET